MQNQTEHHDPLTCPMLVYKSNPVSGHNSKLEHPWEKRVSAKRVDKEVVKAENAAEGAQQH